MVKTSFEGGRALSDSLEVALNRRLLERRCGENSWSGTRNRGCQRKYRRYMRKLEQRGKLEGRGYSVLKMRTRCLGRLEPVDGRRREVIW